MIIVSQDKKLLEKVINLIKQVFIMGVLLLLGCTMAISDAGIQSPYEKIDDKLWEAMVTTEPDYFDVVDEMEGSGVLATSVTTVEKYPVIVTYTTTNPDAELKIINGDVKELYIQEIMQLSYDNGIKKLYLDSEVELNLNQALPLINGMSATVAGEGSKVCILDTGLDKTHLALKYPVLEWDFVNKDGDASDDHFHGTHVAGIVVSSNPTYRGVAPAADLMIGKVISSSGSGSYSNIMRGLYWCVENDADVISMSFGGGLYQDTCDHDILAIGVNNIANNNPGVVLVASAGNKGNAGGGSPGCASGVIGVGATDKTKGKRESWSSRTLAADVTAPGYQIMSTMPNNGWHAWSGTSMAAPMVSGSVAVLTGLFPDATSDMIKNALYSTSKCHKKNRCEVGEGYGLINVYGACQFMEGGEEAENQDTEATSYQVSAQKAVSIVKLGGSRYKGFSPSCVDYKTDDFETYLSVSEDGNKYFTAKKYCRERRKYNKTTRKYEYYTKCYERSSSYAPTRNILFYTDEGYPVQVRGSRGRYYFYVWYDTDVDRATRNKAHAWQYKPLRSRDSPLDIVAEAKKSIGCGPCDKLFGVGGGKKQLT